ncbi:unnamed protein product [Urochloa humidicola]
MDTASDMAGFGHTGEKSSTRPVMHRLPNTAQGASNGDEHGPRCVSPSPASGGGGWGVRRSRRASGLVVAARRSTRGCAAEPRAAEVSGSAWGECGGGTGVSAP